MFLRPSRFMPKLIRKQTANKIRNFSTEQPILTKEVGNNALIILNRQKSLNAMTVALEIQMFEALKKFENLKSLVILKGAGDRAFSAGGDLLKLKEASKNSNVTYMEDQILNLNRIIYLVYNYKIPIVALLNGITFGGGAGSAIFAKYRVATEKTRFAMPESKIAFHPNAAASVFFNRSPRQLGYYLALTGNSVTGADVFRAGYATHFCNSNNLNKLEEELLNCSDISNIDGIFNSICEKNIPEFSVEPVMDKINKCFSEPSVEGICSKLKQDGSSWAQETLHTLNQYSPTSLKVILRQLQKGKNMDLVECLAMESNLTVNFYNYMDVLEGTRVVLEDRNDIPKWNPPKLSEVSESLIEEHFRPTLEDKQRKLIKEIDDYRSLFK